MSDEEITQIRGLEFMARRYNVIDKQLELAVTKKITPTENNLLTLIELGTNGARNARRVICSTAEFFLEDLSQQLGYKETDKIWKLLKGLHAKKLIIREATRSKGREILGLNPEVFGQILIDKSLKEEKKRHLKLVDNSKIQPTNHPTLTDEPSVANVQPDGGEPTNRRESAVEPCETINKKPLLDSFRTSKTLKREIRESSASSGEQAENFQLIRELLQGSMKSMR